MTSTHDIKAAFDDLRALYKRSGSYNQTIDEGFDNLARELGICDSDVETERIVRAVINKCIWDPGSDHGTAMQLERDSVERLMRLIKKEG